MLILHIHLIGGDINIQDSFGRTPLHVAVSVDFAEMAGYLLDNHADIDSRTLGELQAPIHYAAKNGAVKSLKLLLEYHANIDSLDYRQRSRIHTSMDEKLEIIWQISDAK